MCVFFLFFFGELASSRELDGSATWWQQRAEQWSTGGVDMASHLSWRPPDSILLHLGSAGSARAYSPASSL